MRLHIKNSEAFVELFLEREAIGVACKIVGDDGREVGSVVIDSQSGSHTLANTTVRTLANQLVAKAVGVEGACGCGAFAKYLDRLGFDGIAADPGAVARRLVIEARRRADELDKQADAALERAEKAREAVAGLSDDAALDVVKALGGFARED